MAIIIFLGIFIELELLEEFSLFDFSRKIFDYIFHSAIGNLVLLAFPVLMFLLNRWFFNKNHYPEKYQKKAYAGKEQSLNLSFLNKLGITGTLISLWLKLILRHKWMWSYRNSLLPKEKVLVW